MFFQDVIDTFIAWFRSRKWRRIVRHGVAIFLLPVVALALVLYGWSHSRSHLAGRYLTLVDQQVTQTIRDVEQPSDEAFTPNRELQVPLRRILQLGSSNERVSFVVANELARQGRLVMAERMMRDIAPADGEGFPEAHAWLAHYELAKRNFDLRLVLPNRDAAEMLLNDLEVAEKRATRITSELIRFYAALLFKFGREDEALVVLRNRSKQFPDLNSTYAELANQLDERQDFRTAIEEGRADAESRLNSGKVEASDVARLVRFAQLENDLDRALATAAAGVRSSPEDPNLRRIYSNTLCAKYLDVNRQAMEQSSNGKPGESGLAVGMEYLDAAFKADSGNPVVVAEVAKAMAMGQTLTDEMRSGLEASLADGSAPAVTHLIIANSKLVGDDPSSAIPHLQLALRQLPDSAIIMNNLAFALLAGEADDLDQAVELIERAIRLPGSSSQMVASMLDTQGQIRVAKEDLLGAIESFEKAIRLDQSKLNTRRRLADVYRQVGMADLADAQLRRIEELEESEE